MKNIDTTQSPLQECLPPGEAISGMRLTRTELALFLSVLVGYLLIVVCGHWARFDVVSSDSIGYLKWSREWWDFDRRELTHLPMYPMFLWLFRTISLGWLDNGTLLRAASATCAIGSLLVFTHILRRYYPAARNLGILLFGLYPFVALGPAYDPRADALAIFCIVGLVFGSLSRKWWFFALCLAVGLITHKAIWPFLVLLAVEACFRKKCPPYILALAALPLVIYWAWGLSHGQSLLWLLQSNYKFEFAAHSSLPIMDGLIGTLLHQSLWSRFIKGLVVLGLFGVIVGLLTWNIRRGRSSDSLLYFALLFPVLVLLLILNQYEIWASVRFSGVISLPLACAIVGNPRMRRFFESPTIMVGLFLALAISNLAFGVFAMLLYSP